MMLSEDWCTGSGDDSTTSSELVIYGYSILDYARKYDRIWRFYLSRLKRTLLKSVQSVSTKKANELAIECVFHICSYLDAEDLFSATKVNKEWHIVSMREELWSNLLKSNFGITSRELKIKKQVLKGKDGVSSKELYQIMEMNFRALITVNYGYKTQPVIPASFLT